MKWSVTLFSLFVNCSQVAPGRNDWARDMLHEIPTIDGWHFKVNLNEDKSLYN